MEKIKKNISNILFFGFVVFLFTPYGLSTKTKLIAGVSSIKTFVWPLKPIAKQKRKTISTLNIPLKAIQHAKDVNVLEFKGKVIFINYWATWCPPCIAEMPSLQYLYNEYKDKVVFLFITSDSQKKVTDFYQTKQLMLPTYQLKKTLPKEINSNSLPTTYIIDKQGRIVLETTGASDWSSEKVKSLLDSVIAE